MKVAICDDEMIFRKEAAAMIVSYFGVLETSCEEYPDGSLLLSAVERGKRWDVIFLDIEMSDLNGMKTAEKIRECGIDTPIIFLTSHTEFAMEGYEVSAFRFLEKPIQPEKMKKTLADLEKYLSSGKRIFIRYEGEDVVLPVKNIIYAEAQNNSVEIVLTGQIYRIRKKLSVFEKELSEVSGDFFRVHRGYLINLKHVKKSLGKEVILTGDVSVPVSRSLSKEFKERLFQYVRESAR